MTNLKKIFKKLQTDAKSVLFTEEIINEKMFKKLKKSAYVGDKEFTNLFVNRVLLKMMRKNLCLLKQLLLKKKMTEIGLSFIVSMTHHFNCCTQTLAILNFWESLLPKYCLVFLDLFPSKVYVYLMKSRKSIAAEMETIYKEVQDKTKVLKTRLQTDLEFKQKKIFDLNKKHNVEMFSTVICGGKDFPAEQKLRELKKRIFRLKALERKNLGG